MQANYRNTLESLKECWDDMGGNDLEGIPESRDRHRLIKLCVKIALNYGDDVGLGVIRDTWGDKSTEKGTEMRTLDAQPTE